MTTPVRLATRKSALALAQTALARRALAVAYGLDPESGLATVQITTTGDRKIDWSLEQQGGKGLFTKEIEQALLEGEADIAVHSAKDLPTEMDDRLELLGCLPRGPVNDVLIVGSGTTRIRTIATSSPRRRSQLERIMPGVVWSQIRGNVESRLRKIGQGVADATVLAAAGLNRLGIYAADGVAFRPLPVDLSVPAAGQAAIALQCRRGERERFQSIIDPMTTYGITVERIVLERLGGGCHSATAAHLAGNRLLLFSEELGQRVFQWKTEPYDRILELTRTPDGEAMARLYHRVDDILKVWKS